MFFLHYVCQICCKNLPLCLTILKDVKDLFWRMGCPNPMWVGIMTSSVTSSTRTRLGVITVWGKRGLLSHIYRAAGGSEELQTQKTTLAGWYIFKKTFDISIFNIEIQNLFWYPSSHLFIHSWLTFSLSYNTTFSKHELARSVFRSTTWFY